MDSAVLITPQLLKAVLQACRSGQKLPDEVIRLQALNPVRGKSIKEQNQYVLDQLTAMVERALAQKRLELGLSGAELDAVAKKAYKEALRKDFQQENETLEAWSSLYYRYFAPLELSQPEINEVISCSERNFRRRWQLGWKYLADEWMALERHALEPAFTRSAAGHLPTPDFIWLFGVDPFVQRIDEWFSDPAGPRFVSLEGLGGIGKTTTAQAASRQMAQSPAWIEVLWVSARQTLLTAQGEIQQVTDPVQTLNDVVARLVEQLTLEDAQDKADRSCAARLERLKPVLNRLPYLVVIDNLETFAELEMLLPALQPLAGATRFILTSRHTLAHFPFVQRIQVPELSPAHAQALFESELERRGRCQSLSAAEFEPVYRAVGGLPLALKLTAAQAASLSLAVVLAGLRSASFQSQQALFDYIYHATWRLLSEPAKALLLSMLAVSPDGEDLDWLRQMCLLPVDEFHAALAQLLDFSLIEIDGSIAAPLYRLHRLTTTFLQTEILLSWNDSRR